MGESRWRRVARFSLGNEMKEAHYMEEEEKKCRLCGGEMESWEHVWEDCREWMEEGGNWRWSEYWQRRGRESGG